MVAPGVRCVVTGIDGGVAVVRSDAAVDGSEPLPGVTVWPLLHLAGPVRGYDDGAPRAAAGRLEPGGVSVQVVERQPGDGWPDGGGWRRSGTQDLTVVASGRLLAGLDGGEVELGPGDTLVNLGARHRLRALGGPCRVLTTHLAPGAGAPVGLAVREGGDGASGVRRVVVGVGPDGRSSVRHDGEPAQVLVGGSGVVLADVWQTGGPLRALDQGGDSDEGWRVEPVGRGVAVGTVELPPGDYSAAAHWHATETIDVDLVLSGRLELHLRDLPPVLLEPGDVVVQRGTDHRWQPLGAEAMRMATVRLGV